MLISVHTQWLFQFGIWDKPNEMTAMTSDGYSTHCFFIIWSKKVKIIIIIFSRSIFCWWVIWSISHWPAILLQRLLYPGKTNRVYMTQSHHVSQANKSLPEPLISGIRINVLVPSSRMNKTFCRCARQGLEYCYIRLRRNVSKIRRCILKVMATWFHNYIFTPLCNSYPRGIH